MEFLGLLDAHPFDCRDESSLTISRNTDSLVAWAERMGMDKKELEGLDQEQQLLKILRLGQERQVLPVSADVSTVKKYLEIMMANRSAARSYTVTKPIQTDLHLVSGAGIVTPRSGFFGGSEPVVQANYRSGVGVFHQRAPS